MAGKSSRFFKQGYSIPKYLLNIENKTMIEKAIECLPQT